MNTRAIAQLATAAVALLSFSCIPKGAVQVQVFSQEGARELGTALGTALKDVISENFPMPVPSSPTDNADPISLVLLASYWGNQALLKPWLRKRKEKSGN